VFLWLVFLSGVIGSAIQYEALVSGGPNFSNSYGSSGIVYEALGVLVAANIGSLSVNIGWFVKERTRISRWRKRGFKLDWKFLRIPLMITYALFLLLLLLFNLTSLLINPTFSGALGDQMCSPTSLAFSSGSSDSSFLVFCPDRRQILPLILKKNLIIRLNLDHGCCFIVVVLLV
jgi:hypothetical protein